MALQRERSINMPVPFLPGNLRFVPELVASIQGENVNASDRPRDAGFFRRKKSRRPARKLSAIWQKSLMPLNKSSRSKGFDTFAAFRS